MTCISSGVMGPILQTFQANLSSTALTYEASASLRPLTITLGFPRRSPVISLILPPHSLYRLSARWSYRTRVSKLAYRGSEYFGPKRRSNSESVPLASKSVVLFVALVGHCFHATQTSARAVALRFLLDCITA
jgi:hypothetical protein